MSLLWCEVSDCCFPSSLSALFVSCLPVITSYAVPHLFRLHALHALMMSFLHLVHMCRSCLMHAPHHFSCGSFPMHTSHIARAVMTHVAHGCVCSHALVHSRCHVSVVVCRCCRVCAVLLPCRAVPRRFMFACTRKVHAFVAVLGSMQSSSHNLGPIALHIPPVFVFIGLVIVLSLSHCVATLLIPVRIFASSHASIGLSSFRWVMRCRGSHSIGAIPLHPRR